MVLALFSLFLNYKKKRADVYCKCNQSNEINDMMNQLTSYLGFKKIENKDNEIYDILLRNPVNPEKVLVKEANKKGGLDNITVIIVDNV